MICETLFKSDFNIIEMKMYLRSRYHHATFLVTMRGGPAWRRGAGRGRRPLREDVADAVAEGEEHRRHARRD